MVVSMPIPESELVVYGAVIKKSFQTYAIGVCGNHAVQSGQPFEYVVDEEMFTHVVYTFGGFVGRHAWTVQRKCRSRISRRFVPVHRNETGGESLVLEPVDNSWSRLVGIEDYPRAGPTIYRSANSLQKSLANYLGVLTPKLVYDPLLIEHQFFEKDLDFDPFEGK